MRIFTEERHGGHFRVLEVNGERVSHLGIQDHQIRIGPAVFKMGGIGGVATDWRHRKKGYARIVMEDSIRYMKDEGYDITMLYGIEHFYHKFGFANCMPETVSRVRTRDAEAAVKEARGFRTRPLKDSDWPTVLRLYNRNNALRSLSVVRTRKKWRGIRHGSGFKMPAEAFVVEAKGGRFAGYAIVDSLPEATTACEVETGDPAAMRAILAELVRAAIARRDGEIAVQLPGDHPFTAYLRRFGCKTTITYKNSGGIMGRFINQDAVLSKLVVAYATESRPGCRAATVTVKTDLTTSRVTLAGASTRAGGRIDIPSTTLFQVITGIRTADEVLLSPGVKASSTGAALLRLLEPGLEPYMYSVDHF